MQNERIESFKFSVAQISSEWLPFVELPKRNFEQEKVDKDGG